LQPFFAAGEVIFMGARAKFQKLIDELLGFPYGLNDTINALAYMLEIKPGEPVFDTFTNRHVIDAARLPQWAPKFLLLNSDGRDTTGILVSFDKEVLTVIADWHESGAPGHVIVSLARQARAIAGAAPLLSHAPPDHFKPYDSVGLTPAARSAGLAISPGGSIVQGRGELRRMMAINLGQEPTFQVSRQAAWTLRAMGGGYAREPGKTEATPGPYRLIGEALESFAAIAAAQMGDDAKPNAFTKDGRPYLSSLPKRYRVANNA
jgi:hypothetical protein